MDGLAAGWAAAVWTAALGVSGAVVGSFVALLTLRLPAGLPVGMARSRCSGCGRQLRAHELVPLLSYLIQRGRCRRCGAAIERRYPLIEAAGALIGIVAALVAAAPLAAAVLGWALLLLAILDFEHQWLPSTVTLPLLAAGLLACWWLTPALLPTQAIGAAVGFASLAVVAGAYRWWRGRDGLGGGDVRLFAAAGAWCGWDRLPLVLLGAALAALAAVLLMGRRFSATDRLPFGVFLAPAIWAVYLWQP